jgi:hypothetical protein
MAGEKPVQDTLTPEQKAWVDSELAKAGETAVTKFKTDADEARKKGLPTEYKLEFAQDSALDPTGDREEIVAYLKAQGFSNEQAAAHLKHLEKVAGGLKSRQKARTDAEVAKWADDVKQHPTLGGANFEATQTNVKRVMDWLGDRLPASKFRELVNTTGLGNHPEFVTVFNELGRGMAEDSTTILGRSTSGGDKKRKSDAEVFYGENSKK